jgi:hypothetical protein
MMVRKLILKINFNIKITFYNKTMKLYKINMTIIMLLLVEKKILVIIIVIIIIVVIVIIIIQNQQRNARNLQQCIHKK